MDLDLASREGRWGPLRICCRYGQNESLPYPALPLPLSRSKSEREKQNSWPTQLPGFNSAYPLSPSRLKSERERAPSLLTHTHFFKERTGKTTDIVDLYPFPSPFFPSLSRLKSERERKKEPKSHPKRSAFGETWNLGLSAKGRKKVNGEKESSEGMNFDLG